MRLLRPLLLTLFIIHAIAASAQKITYYSGKIIGYSPASGVTNGKVLIDNVVTGLQEMYLIRIEHDGRFFAEFPLRFNRQCWVSFRFFNCPVYFEAGKKVVQNINIIDPSKVTSTFDGAGRFVNNDLEKVRPIVMDYDWNAIYSDIEQLTPGEFKAYFLKRQAHKQALIDSVAKTNGLNDIAYRLSCQDIGYRTASDLMQYNHIRESSYRRKEGLSFKDRTPILKTVRLTSDFYDFLKNLRYNYRGAMASQAYYEFINHLMFIDPIYDEAGLLDYTKEIALLSSRDTTNESIKAAIRSFKGQMAHQATPPGALEEARPVVLKKLIGKPIALELEFMYLQSVGQRLDREKDTLSRWELKRLSSRVKQKWVLNELLALNNQIKQSLIRNKGKIVESKGQPKLTDTSSNIYLRLISKYKGKVVFVDFWATWCVPCMQATTVLTPLKTELLKNDNIVFLYITNHTSPEKSYMTVIPEIKGEHYRLTDEQYKQLALLFKVYGLPHYALINKRGQIVNDNFQWNDVSQVKQRLTDLVND